MIKWLLISAFAHFFVYPKHSQSPQLCEELRAEVTTEKATPGSEGGKITVTYPQRVDADGFVLHLFAIKGITRRDLQTTEITGVAPGKYILIISDPSSKYCPRQVDIEITQ